MNRIKEVYKCEICGNIVEIVHAGGGVLVCCGQPMILQIENTVDVAKERNVPVVKKFKGSVLVKVGAVEYLPLQIKIIM